MRINVVFNLETVEELEELTRALKEPATLQAKIKLENNIRDLKREKENLRKQLNKLKDEHRDLTGKDREEAAKLTEATAPEPHPSSSFSDDADRIIDTIPEEVYEDERIE